MRVMKLGFIGLGNMGSGMVGNLLKAGNEVVVFDIDQEKLNSAVSLGASSTKSIEILSRSVETVILCLPHPEISKEVIFEKLISQESIITTIIDTSTLTLDATRYFLDELKKQNVDFLCAPMLGGKIAAMNKEIHFLIEGSKSVFEQYKDLFLCMGKRADYMGEIPNATLAKLAYNICRYSNIATATEVARLLRSYTGDTSAIYELLAEGSLDNFGQVWKEDVKEMVVDGKFYEPGHIPEKDLTLISGIAKEKNLSSNLYAAIIDVYKSLRK